MQVQDNNQMSKVFTNITIINHDDQIHAEYENISAEQVRSLTLYNVLVSSETTILCLPADVIAKLGLRVLKEINITTATGIKTTRIYQDATISVCGREGTFECLELPEGEKAILGLIPLEVLGLKFDFKTHQLKVLSISSIETYGLLAA